MRLRVSKNIIKIYFEYLYHSILPNCVLWDKKSVIIIEPICIFKIQDFNIVNCKLIDKLLNSSFKVSDIRALIKHGIDNLDWSELEQILFPLFDNIFELGDNPLSYPGKRMEDFVVKVLPRNPDICQDTDGICHFHPTKDTSLSDKDIITMREFAGVMKSYGKNSIISVVISRDDILQCIEEAKKSKVHFINYIMSTPEMTQINVSVFYSHKKEEKVSVTII